METIDYKKFIDYAADHYYAQKKPNRGSILHDAAKDYERLRAIETVARALADDVDDVIDLVYSVTPKVTADIQTAHLRAVLADLRKRLGE